MIRRGHTSSRSHRRLSKDYEFAPSTSEAMLYAAMVHFMARRLGGLDFLNTLLANTKPSVIGIRQAMRIQ
jgi:hypothetical protein